MQTFGFNAKNGPVHILDPDLTEFAKAGILNVVMNPNLSDFDEVEAIAESVAKRAADLLKPRTEDDPDLAMLHEASQTGIKAGSAMAQRLMRSLTPEEKEEYKNLGKGYSEKSEWRKRWAAKQYTLKKKEKTETESWGVEDITEGQYLSFSRVLQEEGGNNPTWQDQKAAFNYVLRCCLLGHEWTLFNEMTGRTDFFYISKMRRESFARKWGLCKVGIIELKAPDKSAAKAVGSGEAKEGASDRSAAQAGESGEAKEVAGAKGQGAAAKAKPAAKAPAKAAGKAAPAPKKNEKPTSPAEKRPASQGQKTKGKKHKT